jgi:hypothetical protein
MSIEYFAAVEPSDDCIAALLHELQLDHRYEVLPSPTPRRILLRLTKQPARTEWPEDVEISFRNGIYIAFHAADRDCRETLLALLKSKLAECGYPVDFEES